MDYLFPFILLCPEVCPIWWNPSLSVMMMILTPFVSWRWRLWNSQYHKEGVGSRAYGFYFTQNRIRNRRRTYSEKCNFLLKSGESHCQLQVKILARGSTKKKSRWWMYHWGYEILLGEQVFFINLLDSRFYVTSRLKSNAFALKSLKNTRSCTRLHTVKMNYKSEHVCRLHYK